MDSFDAVVIGSGYGGSVVAARLGEAGLRVRMLERGLRHAPGGFQQSDDLKVVSQVVDVVVTSGNIAYRTGKIVGGASVPMDGAHFRIPTKSFAATDENGRRYWPEVFSRAVLDPYYAKVEAMLHIRQLGWHEISKAGGMFGKVLKMAGASAERARLNYRDCLHCGFCAQGCIYQKKVTMLHSYIPLAEAHGVEIVPEANVHHLEPTTGGAGGTGGYRVSYTERGESRQVDATRVIVAGGGIHSAALLLRSRPYLTALGAHVGEHFNNNGEHPFIGILPPDFAGIAGYDCFKGMDNAGLMSFHWYDSDGITLHPGGGIEPSAFAANLASATNPALPAQTWGLPYKRFVASAYPHRVIAFSALGLAPGHTAITINADGNADAAPRDRVAYDAYLDRLEAIVQGIADKSGVTIVPTVSREYAGTTSTHLLSACRMADTAADGVIDADCQTFGHENLYVCDASALPYAIAVNPALTIAALAERTAERIIERG